MNHFLLLLDAYFAESEIEIPNVDNLHCFCFRTTQYSIFTLIPLCTIIISFKLKTNRVFSDVGECFAVEYSFFDAMLLFRQIVCDGSKYLR